MATYPIHCMTAFKTDVKPYMMMIMMAISKTYLYLKNKFTISVSKECKYDVSLGDKHKHKNSFNLILIQSILKISEVAYKIVCFT